MNRCDRCGKIISEGEDFCDPCWEALPDADDTEAVEKDCETWFNQYWKKENAVQEKSTRR